MHACTTIVLLVLQPLVFVSSFHLLAAEGFAHNYDMLSSASVGGMLN